MVRINYDWVVDVDEYNYTLKKDLHKKTPRKNTDGTVAMVDSYKAYGYYSSLSDAVNALFRTMVASKLSDGEVDLNEAVRRIEECEREWREITEEILKGV